MASMDERTVAERVRKALAKHASGRHLIEVEEAHIRRKDGWWYVPVVPVGEVPKTFEYYTILSDAEGDLEENEGLNVLLVPGAPAISEEPEELAR